MQWAHERSTVKIFVLCSENKNTKEVTISKDVLMHGQKSHRRALPSVKAKPAMTKDKIEVCGVKTLSAFTVSQRASSGKLSNNTRRKKELTRRHATYTAKLLPRRWSSVFRTSNIFAELKGSVAESGHLPTHFHRVGLEGLGSVGWGEEGVGLARGPLEPPKTQGDCRTTKRSSSGWLALAESGGVSVKVDALLTNSRRGCRAGTDSPREPSAR